MTSIKYVSRAVVLIMVLLVSVVWASGAIYSIGQEGEQILVMLDPSMLKRVWVGCTIWDGDQEVDLPAKKVSALESVCTFFLGEHSRGYHDAVVAVWGRRVDAEDCHNGPKRKACQWCRMHGYHLEEEMDRRYFTVEVR
ncbi:MAG: hypothetical protein KJ970_02425 [Candidatus Eisenbacteria bacterium]|uniref:Uncharacterized protein n=1 Tax=Eiseniibacteriota bacterium TaxID=2212470 RepID=A0A948W4V9_UNCEI|nr:hypothetical protein [Candidatus Eisenbacteria bacterium]MBU1949095.1 hypothetical protein [Candidatus Eisenbacteria bacterium]MBU2689754.1 hypothetical protein [Candidatus Eisenbacteria bacterium]